MPNRTTVETYTARNRHQHHTAAWSKESATTRFSSAAMKAAAAPQPAIPPAPFGDLSAASISELCDLAGKILPDPTWTKVERCRHGIRLLFGHLQTLPGHTWQDRWEASGFNAEMAPPVSILGRPEAPFDNRHMLSALKVAFAIRCMQPSLSGFRANKFSTYAEPFRRLQKDPRLDEFFETVDADQQLSTTYKNRAKFDITCALTTQGIALEHLTPSALLHYSLENKRLGLTHGANKDTTRFAALGAWEILHTMAHFPPGTAPTLRTFIYNGQRTVEELVDQYNLKNTEVRQLLIDYLVRRKSDTDYNTLEGLARHLAGLFWAVIEEITPGQKDLRLSQELHDQWRAEIQYWRKKGQTDRTRERKDVASVLLSVRGLYVDLHSWAIAEPERWAQWVAPCPILPRDLKGFGKRRRELNRRMAERTRTRQPLLPVLTQHVESRYEHLAGLLEAARPVSLGEPFEHHGRHYSRTNTREDPRPSQENGRPRRANRQRRDRRDEPSLRRHQVHAPRLPKALRHRNRQWRPAHPH